MNDIKQQVPVIFRKYSTGEVIALFPGVSSEKHPSECRAYFLGQLCSFDPSYVLSYTRPAKPLEYFQIKDELESIGYKVKVCNRYTYRMLKNRLSSYTQKRG